MEQLKIKPRSGEFTHLAVTSCLCLCLSGCFDEDKPLLRQVKMQPGKAGKLQPVSSTQQLTRFIKNGLLAQAGQEPNVMMFDDVAAMVNAGESSGFSGVNVQVNGVDEADKIRYDGSTLYMAENPAPYYSWGDAAEQNPDSDQIAKVRVMSTTTAPVGAQELGIYSLSETGMSINGMYLTPDASALTLVTSNFPQVWIFGLWGNPWSWSGGRTGLHQLNALAPGQLQEAFKLEINAHLIDSRRVGDQVYLITRFTPRVEGLTYHPQSDAEKLANQTLVDALPVEALLPQITINGAAPQTLVDGEDCYLPEATDADEGYATLVTVTSVNLSSQAINSRCVAANSSGIFASTSGIYLLAADSAQTAIHKMNFTDGDVVYSDSVSLNGLLGFRNPSFRLGEEQGVLSVVASVSQENAAGGFDLSHQLSTFASPMTPTSSFVALAQLPNEQRPEPIGKPGEDIYAVRYFADRAYIVTYQQTDPLYSIDLSDPGQPRIAGALEVTGFSEYLHPLSESYILGVGYDADPQQSNLTRGVKLELFDVSNLEQPQSVAALVIGQRGSNTPIAYDHHALSLLQVNVNQFRLALPRQNYSTLPENSDPDDPGLWYEWTDFGVQMVEISTGQDAGLIDRGALISESSQTADYPSYAEFPRSLLHDDALFFINNHQLWHTQWAHPELTHGPF